MFEVGQVLFVISNKTQKIVPVQVAEQVIRKSIHGQKTIYLVKVPGKEKLVDLTAIDGSVYSAVDEVRSKLNENILRIVNEMIENAVKIADDQFTPFPHTAEEAAPVPETLNVGPSPVPTGEVMRVELEDGTVANVSMPPDSMT